MLVFGESKLPFKDVQTCSCLFVPGLQHALRGVQVHGAQACAGLRPRRTCETQGRLLATGHAGHRQAICQRRADALHFRPLLRHLRALHLSSCSKALTVGTSAGTSRLWYARGFVILSRQFCSPPYALASGAVSGTVTCTRQSLPSPSAAKKGFETVASPATLSLKPQTHPLCQEAEGSWP